MSATKQVRVTLNVSPSLEETVIDWLLSRDGERGFTTYRVSGHSSAHEGLSAAEQVSGRRKRLRFEVDMPRQAVATFLQDANDAIGAADIHCVVSPVLASGSLSEVAADFD